MIPNTKLYWVDDIKQFAVRINNVIVRGNIGNIFPKDISNKNLIKCQNGSKCINMIKNNMCSYLHDPIEMKDIINQSQIIRNYTNSSWMYASNSIDRKNRQMRHIGNRSSLNHDIEKMSKRDKKSIDNEIDMIINQVMHDLLILMALKSKELIPFTPENG